MALAFLLRFVRGTACRSPARAPGFQTAPSTCARCIAPCRSRIALAKVPGRLVSGRRSVHPSVPTRARSTYASRPHVACVIGIGGCRCGDRIVRSKYLNSRCQVPLLFSLCFLPSSPNFMWRAPRLSVCSFCVAGSHDCAACAAPNATPARKRPAGRGGLACPARLLRWRGGAPAGV